MALSQIQQYLLLQAFIELDSTSPVFPSPEKAAENIASVLDVPALINSPKVHYGTKGEREDLLIQIINFRYTVLSLSISDKRGPESFLFRSLIVQISNSISSIVLLAENGYDYQAISQIRNLLELFMMLIVMIESPEKRLEVIKAHTPDDARKVWHKHFNKTQFIKMIKPYSECFRHLVDSVDNWIEDIYKQLSSFSHNDYVNVLLYSLSAEDRAGILHLNLMGNYVTRKGEIYHRLTTAIAPLDLILCALLQNPKVDICMNDLCNFEDDPFHLELSFTLNTLRDICMILYADISNRQEIKEHIPIPFCQQKDDAQ